MRYTNDRNPTGWSIQKAILDRVNYEAEIAWSRKEVPKWETLKVEVEKVKWSLASLHTLAKSLIP